MTLEFANRRIERKFQIYSDQNNSLDFYVCYKGHEPVGNCELFANGPMAKIEDFDILDIHQKQGFGSHIISELLEKCHHNGVTYAYLVTDAADTAKVMYEKVGFKWAGSRTELMFSF